MRLANNGASGHEVLEELLDVLVVDVELLFEGVQFRIAVDLPPFAAQRSILRLSHGPAAEATKGRVGRRGCRRRRGFLRNVRGRFFVVGRGLCRGCVILGTDHTSGEHAREHRGGQQEQARCEVEVDYTHLDTKFFHVIPPAIRMLPAHFRW